MDEILRNIRFIYSLLRNDMNGNSTNIEILSKDLNDSKNKLLEYQKNLRNIHVEKQKEYDNDLKLSNYYLDNFRSDFNKILQENLSKCKDNYKFKVENNSRFEWNKIHHDEGIFPDFELYYRLQEEYKNYRDESKKITDLKDIFNAFCHEIFNQGNSLNYENNYLDNLVKKLSGSFDRSKIYEKENFSELTIEMEKIIQEANIKFEKIERESTNLSRKISEKILLDKQSFEERNKFIDSLLTEIDSIYSDLNELGNEVKDYLITSDKHDQDTEELLRKKWDEILIAEEIIRDVAKKITLDDNKIHIPNQNEFSDANSAANNEEQADRLEDVSEIPFQQEQNLHEYEENSDLQSAFAKKSKHLPFIESIYDYLTNSKSIGEFLKLSKTNQRKLADKIFSSIIDVPSWQNALEAFRFLKDTVATVDMHKRTEYLRDNMTLENYRLLNKFLLDKNIANLYSVSRTLIQLFKRELIEKNKTSESDLNEGRVETIVTSKATYEMYPKNTDHSIENSLSFIEKIDNYLKDTRSFESFLEQMKDTNKLLSSLKLSNASEKVLALVIFSSIPNQESFDLAIQAISFLRNTVPSSRYSKKKFKTFLSKLQKQITPEKYNLLIKILHDAQICDLYKINLSMLNQIKTSFSPSHDPSNQKGMDQESAQKLLQEKWDLTVIAEKIISDEEQADQLEDISEIPLKRKKNPNNFEFVEKIYEYLRNSKNIGEILEFFNTDQRKLAEKIFSSIIDMPSRQNAIEAFGFLNDTVMTVVESDSKKKTAFFKEIMTLDNYLLLKKVLKDHDIAYLYSVSTDNFWRFKNQLVKENKTSEFDLNEGILKTKVRDKSKKKPNYSIKNSLSFIQEIDIYLKNTENFENVLEQMKDTKELLSSLKLRNDSEKDLALQIFSSIHNKESFNFAIQAIRFLNNSVPSYQSYHGNIMELFPRLQEQITPKKYNLLRKILYDVQICDLYKINLSILNQIKTSFSPAHEPSKIVLKKEKKRLPNDFIDRIYPILEEKNSIEPQYSSLTDRSYTFFSQNNQKPVENHLDQESIYKMQVENHFNEEGIDKALEDLEQVDKDLYDILINNRHVLNHDLCNILIKNRLAANFDLKLFPQFNKNSLGFEEGTSPTQEAEITPIIHSKDKKDKEKEESYAFTLFDENGKRSLDLSDDEEPPKGPRRKS